MASLPQERWPLGNGDRQVPGKQFDPGWRRQRQGKRLAPPLQVRLIGLGVPDEHADNEQLFAL
ncbi:MAG: hypothetical protein F4Z75_04690 [Synechococcus sp. SB0668_bin_15]|nr:hypothetical protein [Synechococcus sp. SB0668_bin_15]